MLAGHALLASVALRRRGTSLGLRRLYAGGAKTNSYRSGEFCLRRDEPDGRLIKFWPQKLQRSIEHLQVRERPIVESVGLRRDQTGSLQRSAR